jgi:hypothetical protein
MSDAMTYLDALKQAQPTAASNRPDPDGVPSLIWIRSQPRSSTTHIPTISG